ncbi:MAG TPA: hypothetical protein VIG04_11400 [Gemmatimonadales bacterium]|jgi:hypothetical protein
MGPFRSALPLCLVLLLGCGSEPPDQITGTYTLVGVEGQTLPYLESSDAECDQFISEGELTLDPGGTYNLEFFGPRSCADTADPPANFGRVYSGTFTQSGASSITYATEVQGAGTLHFTGTANPLEAFVTVPPIPPQTGPDLTLQFAIVP